jgi:LCP family protein required for cell wall assembly
MHRTVRRASSHIEHSIGTPQGRRGAAAPGGYAAGMSEPQRPRPHGRITRAFVVGAASLSIVIALGTAFGAVRWVQLRDIGTDDTVFTPTTGTPSASGSGTVSQPRGDCSRNPCNFLVLGSDSRANLTPEQQAQFGSNNDIGGSNRADTIMVVHTDPNLDKAIILSFPRDLWVNIPDHGMDKINVAFEGGIEGGGPGLMARTVTNLTGLGIDHYLYVDLAGFQKVVDTLGGVDMCIPAYDVNTPGWLTQDTATGSRQVYYSEPGHVVDPNTGLDVMPGCQHLDGYQALAFVRTRHLPCDAIPDFSRIGRQQQFLRAVINQMLQPTELAKAPGLVQPILENMHRDSELLPGDLVYLVGQLRGLVTGAAEFRAVPGIGGFEGNISVVHMLPEAHQIFNAIIDGQPLGDIGLTIGSTPISPANVQVAVIDDASGTKAAEVEKVLADSGFDITPGIWSADKKPPGISGAAAIVYKPGHNAEAEVVGKYLPGVKLIESAKLQGVSVAVVVTAAYAQQQPGTGGTASACPTP